MDRHLTEAELVAYACQAFAGCSPETDPHLTACDQCAAGLAGIRAFDKALGDEDTWESDGEDSLETLQNLQRLAAQVAEEDVTARRLLKDFISAPAALAWADIATQRKYHTGAVVRLLTKTAQELCEREPLHAFNFAEAAVDVARALADDVYPAGGVWELRGAAWKARANALRYLNDYAGALLAIAEAERAYRKLPNAGVGLAAVHHVRASVLREQEEYGRALAEAKESARAYLHLRQTERYFAARNVEGQIYFDTHRYVEAGEVFRQILAYAETVTDESWMARASLNLGNVHLELAEWTAAWDALNRALVTFRHLDLATEAARAEGGIGILLTRNGKQREGIVRLKAAREVFLRHGMPVDAAVVTLYIADALLALGLQGAIPSLTEDLIELFVASGKMTGALTALAFLKEAAAARTLKPAGVAHVRAYLQRLDRRPDLIFAPPPEAL